MDTETYKTYEDLSKTATSHDEIVELRAMAAQEAGGNTKITVHDEETGISQTIDVKLLGRGTLAALDRPPIELAQASTDWHSNEH